MITALLTEYSSIMIIMFGDQRSLPQILHIPGSMLIHFPLQLSIGFSSEDWDGYGRTLILCSVTLFIVVDYVCFGSLL